jgi:hypothetical protein
VARGAAHIRGITKGTAMTAAAESAIPANYQNQALRGILLGGGLAGLADFIYPTVKAVMAGNAWTQPWKGVASGLLGQRAREGGLEMALLGAALHWFICLGAAAILYVVVSRLRFIPRQWPVLAIIHGVAVLMTMNYVILPLSAIGRGIYPLEQLHVHAFWHIVLVGLPTGYFIARALRKT